MSEAEHVISNVSDTARWVAAYRAVESARPDALFHDPLADRLAGERGHAIAAAAPWVIRSGWWLVARTKLIDDLIAQAIRDGCDRALTLAAGLDARPYRLDVPSDFVWFEADLPEMVAEKTDLLSQQQPRCRLFTRSVDLADPVACSTFLDEALSGAAKALVLTEGLLMYLEPHQVGALSHAFKRPEIAWWILDYSGPQLLKRMNKKSRGLMQNAPFKFAPPNGLAYFEDLGWTTVDVEAVFMAAHRLHRLPLWLRHLAYVPQPDPRGSWDVPWSAMTVARLAQ